VYNIALRNLNYVVENINEEPEFKQFEEYIVKILREINFTMDLSSSYCDICKTTRETYSSYISNNMNVTMKILAAVTILIAIPNMIFGFYGMNILLPLQDKGFLVLGVIISVMIGLMIILWKYMKKKIL
nr:Mg2+ and Co2+ transporter-like protein [Leptotrichiaceae bacterium]